MALFRGTLIDFNASTYRATVRLHGATPRTIDNIRCTRLPSGEFTAGRQVAVDTGDHNDPEDAVVTAVFS